MTSVAESGPSRRPAVSAPFCEAVAASLLVLWRVWTLPWDYLRRDIVTFVAVFWLSLRFFGGSRFERAATVVAMLALLLIYAWGQVPPTLAILGWRP